MKVKSDAELIKNYKLGDEESFEKLLCKYKGPLFNYILKMIGNKTISEDIFQDVWLNIIKSLHRYKERNKFSAYLFKLAHSRTIDHLRKQKHEIQVARGFIPRYSLSPHEAIYKKELISILNNAVSKLSLKEKEVFLLRQHTEMTFKEIALMLKCPLNTVLGRMHNAILNLRKTFKNAEL
ncbi:sigma-70 family RNA polymerase sigma factor [candidate division WOR-3 bacterium]|nr:sigma-70 family RNA polymerase sigma factor [candidate division WOR-3 bacterium]